MEKLTSEIDFLQIKSPPSPGRAGSSSRGIQSVVAKINPQILKSVMEAGESSGAVPHRVLDSFLMSNMSFSAADVAAGKFPWPLPVLNPNSRSATTSLPESPTLTIFYDGTVVALSIPRAKAEAIISTVESLISKKPEDRAEATLADVNRPDLPIMRRKSLYRFLEKRKERLLSASPYNKAMITTDSC